MCGDKFFGFFIGSIEGAFRTSEAGFGKRYVILAEKRAGTAFVLSGGNFQPTDSDTIFSDNASNVIRNKSVLFINRASSVM